jgi:uncharacterized phage-associated protein
MTITVPQAAKALGTYSNWSITNLQMQKMLYFAHMFFLGRTQTPLIDEEFEAWNYGPVIPSLYKKVRFFGSDNIVDIFHGPSSFPSTPEYQILKEAADSLAHRPASQLVNITHHQYGAWAKHYRPNIKGIKIPNPDILAEYNQLYAG